LIDIFNGLKRGVTGAFRRHAGIHALFDLQGHILNGSDQGMIGPMKVFRRMAIFAES
jgi:hypothetical protein